MGGKPQFCGTVGEARQEWRNAEFIAAANPTVALELVRRLREAEKWKSAGASLTGSIPVPGTI